ncbi:unnamed protein product [Orchesella dallaii]|uniref:SP-RING-type domain-containing protein n=1 Tax=Orchesella dallaii TaxID=48710 RepID=A0ABP1RAG8_9HEXA
MGSSNLGLPATFLLRKLLNKGGVIMGSTKRYIKSLMMMTVEQKLEQELCTATSINVSLLCPLGKSRIIYPCRATTCTHVQIFDAMQYFMLNEIKNTNSCPVCQKIVRFEDLRIDPFFRKVIRDLSDYPDVNEIRLKLDGSWEPVITSNNFSDYDVSEPSPKRVKTITTEGKSNYERRLEDFMMNMEAGKLTVSPIEYLKMMRTEVKQKNVTSANDQIEVIDLTVDDDNECVPIIYVE